MRPHPTPSSGCTAADSVARTGGESILKAHGVEVVNLNLDSCKKLMATFIENHPEVWNEDIGEEDK